MNTLFEHYIHRDGKQYFICLGNKEVFRIFSHPDDNAIFVYYRVVSKTTSENFKMYNKLKLQRLKNGYISKGLITLDNLHLKYKWYIGPQGTDI
jgi:hypothetical protein